MGSRYLKEPIVNNFIRDKFYGHIKLALIADQWGSATELIGERIQDVVTSPRALDKNYPADPWHVWVNGEAGDYLITDDSATSLFLMSRYVEYSSLKKMKFNEDSFVDFIVDEYEQTKASHHPYEKYPFYETYKHCLNDWLGMLNTCLCTENNQLDFSFSQKEICVPEHRSFYKHDESICFGLFLALSLSFFSKADEEAIWEQAFNFTSMDKMHAPYATAFISNLVFKAIHSKQSHFLSFWNTHTEELLLKYPGVTSELIQKSFVDAKYFVFFKDESDEDLFERVFQWRVEVLGQYLTPLRHDPIEFITLFELAMIYAKDDLEKAFFFLINIGGDTDTMGFVFGQLVGAFLGEKRLNQLHFYKDYSPLVFKDFNKLFAIDLHTVLTHWSKY